MIQAPIILPRIRPIFMPLKFNTIESEITSLEHPIQVFRRLIRLVLLAVFHPIIALVKDEVYRVMRVFRYP